jgi:ABC-type sugar transport system permease subunit
MSAAASRLAAKPAFRLQAIVKPAFVSCLALLAPSLILLALVVAYPMVKGLYYTVTDSSLFMPGRFIGWRNYADLLENPEFWHSLSFSAVFSLFAVSGCYSLGLGLALLLNRNFPLRGLLRVALLTPWIVPSLVAVVSWRWMVSDRDALFNRVIEAFGGSPIYFLSNDSWTVVIVILVKIWVSFPFMMLSLLAALQGIDQSIYEAAAIDGAKRWPTFLHITVPEIRKVSAVLCILMTIWTVNDFDTPWLLAQGGQANATENLVVLAYRYTFARNDVGMGATVSFVTLFLLMALFLVVLKLTGGDRHAH